MKYNATDLLTQISNRIINVAGRISKASLGAMLADMADSTVKMTGDDTVLGIKTFSSYPILPITPPLHDQNPVSRSYLGTSLSDFLNNSQFIWHTQPVDVGEVESFTIVLPQSNVYIKRIVVFSATDNQTGGPYEDKFSLFARAARNAASAMDSDLIALPKATSLYTIKASSESASNSIEIENITGYSELGLIRLDTDATTTAPDEMEFARILSKNNLELIFFEQLLLPFQIGSNVRTCSEIEVNKFYRLNSGELNIMLSNVGAQGCDFRLMIEYFNM
jgi:hypothetical protein